VSVARLEGAWHPQAGSLWHVHPLPLAWLAVSCSPQLQPMRIKGDDGLVGCGSDVVIRTRHRQLGRLRVRVEVFRDLLFVTPTNVTATHLIFPSDALMYGLLGILSEALAVAFAIFTSFPFKNINGWLGLAQSGLPRSSQTGFNSQTVSGLVLQLFSQARADGEGLCPSPAPSQCRK
jgi:hypothetical protein